MGVEIRARRDEVNCQWSSSCNTGTDQILLGISKPSSEHGAACCRALVPTHPDRAPKQDILWLPIRAPTILLFRKVQVGTEDLRSDVQPYFAPRCSLEAHLSLTARLPSQFPQSGWCPSAIFCVALQPTQQPSSCLGWFEEFEEASDSLCALPEASLLLLVIVKWKFRLFPASDISISITALM